MKRICGKLASIKQCPGQLEKEKRILCSAQRCEKKGATFLEGWETEVQRFTSQSVQPVRRPLV